MPLYEYECNSCGKVFEQLTAISGKESVHCSACGSDDVKKLLSAGVVKGSTPPGLASAGGCGNSGFS